FGIFLNFIRRKKRSVHPPDVLVWPHPAPNITIPLETPRCDSSKECSPCSKLPVWRLRWLSVWSTHHLAHRLSPSQSWPSCRCPDWALLSSLPTFVCSSTASVRPRRSAR